MKRNQNSRFALNPKVNIPRSRFDMSYDVKTTFNAGLAIPVTWQEILPGDTFNVDTSMLIRMQTLMTPVMGDMYADLYWFFVPNRLLWKHWTNFCGESDEPWFDETVYTVPQLEFDSAPYDANQDHTVEVATVADYLGLPVRHKPKSWSGTGPYMTKVNHLPFRAYSRIWNEWFRNENVQNMTPFNMEDADTVLWIGEQATPFNGGSLPLPVNKYRDIFTSALPQPQRGPAVTIGVGNLAPVFAGSQTHDWTTLAHGNTKPASIRFRDSTSESATHASGSYNLFGYTGSSSNTLQTNAGTISSTGSSPFEVTPANLYADISSATGISINELRLAFATQRFYELAARSGSRYIEILSSMFHVDNGDARLQRSEYLGGNRCRINISQVAQQSETGNTPLGDLGAYSLTTDNQHSFTKSFTEHGILMCIMCVRYDHAYQQGIDRKFLRKDKFDYYWPQFANIGEQPIYNKELFLNGKADDNEVFGYQEAWAEYRYGLSKVSGEFRSDYDLTLDSWHLADDYEDTPNLSSGFIMENSSTIDRITAVSQRLSNQFMADIYFKIDATRPMPVYSVPGLDVL